MKQDHIRYIIFLISTGIILATYAEQRFATLTLVKEVKEESATKESITAVKEKVNDISEEQKEQRKLLMGIYQEVKR